MKIPSKRWLIVFLAFPILIGTFPVFAETDREVIQRHTQGEPIEGQFGRTKKLMKGFEVLVAFVQQKDPNDLEEKNVELNVLQTEKPYARMKIDACEIEGGTAEIVSYFFANADREPGLDVGVICQWPAHRYADCPNRQELRFFNIPSKFGPEKIARIEDRKFNVFERKLPNGCMEPNYKDAADAKKLLKKIGF